MCRTDSRFSHPLDWAPAFRLLFLLLLPTITGQMAAGTPPSASQQVRRIIGKGASARAYWGISVVDIQSQAVVAEVNPDQLLIPASILKLLTGYGALATYGPDHRFTTVFLSPTAVSPDGTIKGTLYIRGGGDPSWTYRFFEDDFQLPVEGLVQEFLRQSGVRRIEGDIVADDTPWLWEPEGPDWSWETLQWAYGSRVTSLSLNDNVLRVELNAGSAGPSPR